jgi:hypothetical protein
MNRIKPVKSNLYLFHFYDLRILMIPVQKKIVLLLFTIRSSLLTNSIFSPLFRKLPYPEAREQAAKCLSGQELCLEQ